MFGNGNYSDGVRLNNSSVLPKQPTSAGSTSSSSTSSNTSSSTSSSSAATSGRYLGLKKNDGVNRNYPGSCICNRNPMHCYTKVQKPAKGSCKKCANTKVIKEATRKKTKPPRLSKKAHAPGCSRSAVKAGTTHADNNKTKQSRLEKTAANQRSKISSNNIRNRPDVYIYVLLALWPETMMTRDHSHQKGHQKFYVHMPHVLTSYFTERRCSKTLQGCYSTVMHRSINNKRKRFQSIRRKSIKIWTTSTAI
jgi:hypothetical protein